MEKLKSKNLEIFSFSGRGEIYSFTYVYDAPTDFTEFTPYPLALIKLEEGNIVTAQLTDLGEEPVYIGMPVEMVTRRIKSNGDKGLHVYGYKFRPRLQPPKKTPW